LTIGAQVDGALLAHPLVAEAVSFGAPDEKFGESVVAAVVLSKPADNEDAVIADIKKFAASKLASFKVTCPSCIVRPQQTIASLQCMLRPHCP
jgi:acyl-CoA synthetase (AMP-forming)/AMP-acid ligase II